MDVGTFADGLVLVRVDVEPVRSESVDDWHAYLVDRVGAGRSMTIDAYLGLIR